MSKIGQRGLTARWDSAAWKNHMKKLNASKRKYPKKHGLKSRIYNIWKAMKFRCLYPSHEAFKRYNGRGIGICDQWKKDYMAFRSWALSSGYASHLTLERIKNEGGYYPGNCRWATYAEQSRNRTNSLQPVEAFGEKKIIVAWAEDPRSCGKYRLIWRRIHKFGWPVEKAITKPSRNISHNRIPNSTTLLSALPLK